MTQTQQLWLDASANLELARGEVHVWRVCLQQSCAAVQPLLNILSSDEQLRASKYYFQRDRERFVLTRGMLRIILSRYINLAPGQISFSHNQYGKPAISSAAKNSPLRFNVSHSNRLALFAVMYEREVGVDLEWVRDDFASLELAERFFSPAEVTALRALPTGARTNAFFECWTRKEAYVKACGRGLSYPLHRFTVSLTPDTPAALLSTDDNPCEASRWSIINLCPAAGYRAALAVEAPPPRLYCWQAPRVGSSL